MQDQEGAVRPLTGWSFRGGHSCIKPRTLMYSTDPQQHSNATDTNEGDAWHPPPKHIPHAKTGLVPSTPTHTPCKKRKRKKEQATAHEDTQHSKVPIKTHPAFFAEHNLYSIPPVGFLFPHQTADTDRSSPATRIAQAHCWALRWTLNLTSAHTTSRHSSPSPISAAIAEPSIS